MRIRLVAPVAAQPWAPCQEVGRSKPEKYGISCQMGDLISEFSGTKGLHCSANMVGHAWRQ
jgi:hypothetical protein